MRKIIFYLNLLSATLLVFSCFATYVNPQVFWAPAFLSLAFPIFWVGSLLFFLFWLAVKKRNVWISTLAFAVTFPYFKLIVQLNVSDKSQSAIKVMSYNVKAFDLYNWKGNNESRNEMIKIIQSEDADIVCLQEFYTEAGNERNMQNIEALKKAGYPYYFFSTTYKNKYDHQWGLATFSKFPIKSADVISFKNSKLNRCIYTDVNIDSNSTVRVYNTHLQSLKFGKKDYEYIKNISENKEVDSKSAFSIVSKLKTGYQKRAQQAHQIHESITAQNGPIILCGDFNDTPISYTYQLLSRNLKDAFTQRGIGLSPTYQGKLPGLRIDYIFTSESLQVKDYYRIKSGASDHYPIVSSLSF